MTTRVFWFFFPLLLAGCNLYLTRETPPCEQGGDGYSDHKWRQHELIRCSYAGNSNIPPFIVECRQMRARMEILVIRPDVHTTNRVLLSGILLSDVARGDCRGAWSHSSESLGMSVVGWTNTVRFVLGSLIPSSPEQPISRNLFFFWTSGEKGCGNRETFKNESIFYLNDWHGEGFFSQVALERDDKTFSSLWHNLGHGKLEEVSMLPEEFFTGIHCDSETGLWNECFFRKGDKTVEIIPDNKERRE